MKHLTSKSLNNPKQKVRIKVLNGRHSFGNIGQKILFLACLFLLSGNVAKAEDGDMEYKPFTGGLHLKNMHTWHGFVVEPGAIFSTSLEYNTKKKDLTLGLWGGASFNGRYKEYSYYAIYRPAKNLTFELVSHNNYTNMATPDMLSYDKEVSPNFFDIAVIYTLSDDVPLTIYWGTILAGQAQDYETDSEGNITDSYSNYVELKYKVWEKGSSKLSLHAGGAFSFSTEKTFYSKEANLVNVGLTLNQTAKVFSKNVPLEFTGFWNPESGAGVLQVDIAIF